LEYSVVKVLQKSSDYSKIIVTLSDHNLFHTKEKIMGTLPPQELLKKWEQEEITVEMAIGHILQHLVKILAALESIKITLRKIRADVDSLIAHTGMKPNPTGKKKPPKQD
jgi:hypothetical protein